MSDDSEEKILIDWNAEKVQPFSNFYDLYRYLEQNAKKQGQPSKKEMYSISLPKELGNDLGSNVVTGAKKHSKNATTLTLNFRRRIKNLKKKGIDSN